jgi:hypothetical protein
VCASALASVSGAAVASGFGMANTIAGAALVSVVATVGSAVYSLWIRRTHEKLQQTPVTKIVELVSRTSPGSTGAAGAPRIGARVGDPSDAGDDRSPSGPVGPASGSDGEGPGWASRWKATLSQRRWGLASGVAVVFVASLVLITMIEVVGQRPLASIAGDERSGGTSIGSLVDGDDPGSSDDTTTTTTSPSSSDTSTPDSSVAEEEDPSESDPSSSEAGDTTTTTSSSTTTTGSSSTTSTTTAIPTTSATPETIP